MHPNKKHRYAVRADRFDFASSGRAIDTNTSLFNVQARMLNYPTGPEAVRDLFHLLIKAVPQVRSMDEMEKKFSINCKVMNEITALEEFKTLRKLSVGDASATSMAVAELANKLEVIFDKLKHAQELAEHLQSLQEQREVMILDENGDWADDIDALQKEIDEAEGQLEDALEEATPIISAGMAEGLSEAQEVAEGIASAVSWGLSKSEVKRMPAGDKVKIAKKLCTPEFKALVDLLGKMDSLNPQAIPDHNSKTFDISDIERGRSWSRMLGSEKAMFGEDTLFVEQAIKFIEGTVPQFKMRGNDIRYRGPITLLCDGSASMSWDGRDTYARAVGLALLKIAQQQQRPFNAVVFGAQDEYILMRYDTAGDRLSVDIEAVTYSKTEKSGFSGFDAAMALAELSFSMSGTDFVTPFRVGIDLLQEDLNEGGKTRGDIVFVTDGECYTSPDWIKTLEEAKERLDFKVFGISVGGSSGLEQIKTVSDMALTIDNLKKGDDLVEMFNAIQEVEVP